MHFIKKSILVLLYVILCAICLLITVCQRPTVEADGKSAANIDMLCNCPFLCDPSFERHALPNQFGLVFPQWDGWRYEGDAEFRVGTIARSGRTSCLLYGSGEPKIRIFKSQKSIEPGRYIVTAYIRGLNIGRGKWNHTIEFAFGDKYFQLNKDGTFGWTKLTYVGEIKGRKEVILPSFGLMAPGYFWIDDVEVKKIDDSTPLTETPIIEEEEESINCATQISNFVRCSECSSKNWVDSKQCCACGTDIQAEHSRKPSILRINSFEHLPFTDRLNLLKGLSLENVHVTDGKKSLKVTKGYVIAQNSQTDWSDFDFLNIDVFVSGQDATDIYVEIHDNKTDGYWTRVNYITSATPGKTVLSIPLDSLYVGEKSRPERKLDLKAVTKLVVGVMNECDGVYFDNVRLERDTKTEQYLFEGLFAFDFGERNSPLMPGFTRIDASSLYNSVTGYGLKDAQLWRSFNVLQPDPLYQDFICIEKGGLAVDLPNGRYRVFVNMDNPSGYWGEYQIYTERKLIIEGQESVVDKMDFDLFRQKYYRNWLTEDMPSDNTFNKYQKKYFMEKSLEVEVSDGQLNIEFEGKNWACSVSAVIIFPLEKRHKGESFLSYVTQKRREFFDSEFKRVLPNPTGDPISPSDFDREIGFIPFVRDYSLDVHYNDTPKKEETETPVLRASAFAGELEPLTVSIFALKDLKEVTLSISDLKGPGTISKYNISIGYVSNRLTRKTMDGRVYTIEPRLVIPHSAKAVKKNTSQRFWITVNTPQTAAAGDYVGEITLTTSIGKSIKLPVLFHVYKGNLAPADIPVGPWGHGINIPWFSSDPKTIEWNKTMAEKSLRILYKSGFTSFSGMPELTYRGFKNGEPDIDFSKGDEQMLMARRIGFTMPINSYGAFHGLNLYYRDDAAKTSAGFTDYSAFIKEVFGAVQKHAEINNWLPVYWNIGDEPIGNDLLRSIENATAYRQAFPQGPPFFTAATSLPTAKPADAHLALAETLHVANLNTHSDKALQQLKANGGNWAFYNNGNRWTYGVYLYKAVKQFDVKFRLGWHWNIVAGDPYYALDCREDDYAWGNSGPNGELVTSVVFEREMREGLDDYRYLLTLTNLADQYDDAAAKKLISDIVNDFKLGETQKEYNYKEFRQKIAVEIERLSDFTVRGF